MTTEARAAAERIGDGLVGRIPQTNFDRLWLEMAIEIAIDEASARAHTAGRREMREEAAKCAEAFPATVIQFYPRGPNSPPGNMKRASTFADIAAAVRALPVEEG